MRFADLRAADLSYASIDDTIISISRIGSRKDITTFNADKNIVWCGCYKGTLEEFESKVKETHKDNEQYLREYLGAIEYFKTFRKVAK